MKNLDLNQYGVQEMNAKEMRETEGGILAFLVVLIGLAIMEAVAPIWTAQS